METAVEAEATAKAEATNPNAKAHQEETRPANLKPKKGLVQAP